MPPRPFCAESQPPSDGSRAPCMFMSPSQVGSGEKQVHLAVNQSTEQIDDLDLDLGLVVWGDMYLLVSSWFSNRK